MKVLLVNGSPHKNGCTYTALCEIKETLEREGIGADIYQLGSQAIVGCRGCYACGKTGKCVINDEVNAFTALASEYDGFVFGSPVYYAGINGSLKSFLDRAFCSSSKRAPHPFTHKPAAAVVSARRAGTTAALDEIQKYFLFAQMPIVSSRYWNMVHGSTPQDVKKDLEGLQIMRVLARNMAWLLKLREAGEKAGIRPPEDEDERLFTNFIR